MRNYCLPSFFFFLLLAIAITLACGSPASHIAASCSSVPSVSNNGMPQTITLCPAVADAQDFPGGQVQFIAIGSYTAPPSPALPPSPSWGVCSQNAPTTGVTITSSGVAHCAAGASGTYTVWAAAGPALCLIAEPCGMCGQPEGTAQLTCP